MKFTVKAKFNASAKELYKAFLDSKEHGKMTGGKAKINSETGKKFSAWDGYISGKNIILEPNKRIVQSWRTTEFKSSDEDSQVEITFAEADGKTEMKIVHTNLAEDGAKYKAGWKDFYFTPMKSYFKKK